MRSFQIMTIIAAFVFAAACGSDQPSNQNSNAGNTGNSANTSTANQAAKAEPSAGPAATLRALSEASQKKDVEGIKRYLSSGTLARLELGAKDQKRTVDELLREEDGAPFPQVPELGKEEISGDTATLEVRNAETNEFEKLPFVKEDGIWKVAIDKYLDDLDAAMEKEQPAKP